jgi:hypothetical protein
MMHDREKSDSAIVAGKLTNKAGKPATESVEPRAGAEGNASQQSTHRAQYRRRVSQALERVRQVAVRTRGGSRMREIRPYGSVRGAHGDVRPYRDRSCPVLWSRGAAAAKRKNGRTQRLVPVFRNRGKTPGWG